MKLRTRNRVSLFAVLLTALLASSGFDVLAQDSLRAFPPAGQGMVRHVLELPEQADESAFKVELIAGQTLELDEGNQYFLGGKFEAIPVEGWGYVRYVVSEVGPLAGTRMAIDPDAAKTARFIRLGGDPLLVHYNSRLPIVVYTPDGVEVRFRIWAASAETTVLPEGL